MFIKCFPKVFLSECTTYFLSIGVGNDYVFGRPERRMEFFVVFRRLVRSGLLGAPFHADPGGDAQRAAGLVRRPSFVLQHALAHSAPESLFHELPCCQVAF